MKLIALIFSALFALTTLAIAQGPTLTALPNTVFVGADGSRPDGDGWVMTYVWDRTTDRSSLAVFDAQDVASGPVGEVQLPVRVPFGFHGTWIPA